MRTVYQLQTIELQEHAIEQERTSSQDYKDLHTIKASFDNKKQRYLHTGEEVKALQAKLASFIAEVAELEAKIAKENTAIYDGSVTSAKELSAREGQIATLEEKLAIFRREQQNCQNALAQTTQKQTELHAELAVLQKAFSEVKARYQAAQEDRAQRLQVLGEQKTALLEAIDSKNLAWYQSRKAKFSGSPLAKLGADLVCGGCRTLVPPITYRRSLNGEATFCEKCGRSLFVLENED